MPKMAVDQVARQKLFFMMQNRELAKALGNPLKKGMEASKEALSKASKETGEATGNHFILALFMLQEMEAIHKGIDKMNKTLSEIAKRLTTEDK